MVCDDEPREEENIENLDMPGSGLLIVSEDDMGLEASKDVGELSDSYNINNFVRNVRSVVLLFKRSPTKNDTILQKYVQLETVLS